MDHKNDINYLLSLLSGNKDYLQNLDSVDVDRLKDLLDSLEEKNDDITLPSKTHRFLSNLRPQDLEDLKDALSFIRNIKTLTRFFRWIFIVLISTFIVAASIGNNISSVWKWIVSFHS